jgi:hypothetical protein
MKTMHSLLFAYRCLLRLYPAGFRERYADEMLHLAENADASEWPLIFSDTSVTIIRTWLHADTYRSTAVVSGPGQYLSLGESCLTPAKLLQGLGLATALVLVACYVSTLTVWHFPVYPDDSVCGRERIKIVRQ